MEPFKGEKLDQMLLKFAPLCSLGIRNLIISLKHRLVTIIFKIVVFLVNKLDKKVYLFKMSVDGVTFKNDLV
jgi:hypothetical protein